MGDVHTHKTCLTTYNPEQTEEHTDSSDFEDPSETKKQKVYPTYRLTTKQNKQQFNKKLKKRKEHVDKKKVKDELLQAYVTKTETENKSIQNSRIMNKTKEQKQLNTNENKVIIQKCTEQTNTCNEDYKENVNKSDKNLQNFSIPLKSKQSIAQSKIIPCFSSLFRKDKKNRAKTNQNKLKLNTNHEVFYVKHECNNSAKNKLEKLYAIQPVLTIDGKMYGLPVEKEPSDISNYIYSTTSCKLTSSNDSSLSIQRKKHKHESKQTNTKKEKKNKQRKQKDNKSKSKYQIYTSNSQFLSKGTSCDACDETTSFSKNDNTNWRNELILTTSEIYDFIAQKHKDRCCYCSNSQGCNSNNCPNRGSSRISLQSPLQRFMSPNFPNPFPYPTEPIPPSQQNSGHKLCPCGGELKLNNPQEDIQPRNLPGADNVGRKERRENVTCECAMTDGKKKGNRNYKNNNQQQLQLQDIQQQLMQTGNLTAQQRQQLQRELTQPGYLTAQQRQQLQQQLRQPLNLTPQQRQELQRQLMQPGRPGPLNDMNQVCNPQFCNPAYNPPRAINPYCQEPHDEMLQKIQTSYNGQVLCIHNPPCVLINGCLNVQGNTQQQNQNFIPPQKRVVCNVHKHKKKNSPANKKCDNSCQYHPPCIEVRQCTDCIVGDKAKPKEQTTQSLCYHDPPCDLVPGCFHPPVQESHPHYLNTGCLTNMEMDKDTSVNGVNPNEGLKPWTSEPVCLNYNDRNYHFFPRGNATTQVKPKTKHKCHHKPPCILIPKCLSKVICEGYLPRDIMPDCLHRPRCHLVPACFKKNSKEMVPLCSHFPASCRIV